VVFGPRQVVARINQDQTISPQITLWNQQGSQVIWGTLMVIPIEESLVYVRPLYLRGEGGRIPELRRVIVAHQNQIVMDNTLDAALTRLFGSDTTVQPTLASGPPPDETGSGPLAQALSAAPAFDAMASEARSRYDRALEAQRAGDWTTYGEEIRELGDLLQRMQRR
jgi:hypothetical protein